jgi:predicted SnoaL-like aldol condensation-catalyzing enzyme
VQTILVDNDFTHLEDYLAGENYLQHNPRFADGISGLASALQALAEQGITMKYRRRHHTVAEGDFVYTLSEGDFGGTPYAFHDLFRVADGRAAEHWDVMVEQARPLPHNNTLF